MTATTTSPADLIGAFRAADTAVEQDRRTWNAMTPQERSTAPRNIGSLHETAKAAALALIKDAAPRHTIEEQAVVYLVLEDDGTWGIGSATESGPDAWPLEGYENGALNEACEHEDGLDDECEALRQAVSAYLPNPTARDLLPLLTAFLA